MEKVITGIVLQTRFLEFGLRLADERSAEQEDLTEM